MIPMLRCALVAITVLFVGLGFALPALAWPLRSLAHQRPSSPSIVVVDCNVYYRNVCYLRMNACFYQHSNGTAGADYDAGLRACEAAYFNCINRFFCRRGPVW
jgi:hypothetical protein